MTLGAEARHSRGSDLYRQTFLRRHIAAELDRVEEVLAVRAIVDRLQRAGRELSRDRRRVLLDQFFQVDEPDNRLYLPLALMPLDNTSSSEVWPSLTKALEASVPAGQPRGIVLSARTGAGKTLATISAFRDALLPARDRKGTTIIPLELAGWLPVRLGMSWQSVPSLARLENAAIGGIKGREEAMQLAGNIATPIVVYDLLAHAAGRRVDSIASIHSWLEYGPPLLVFVDLNEIPSDVSRLALARSLEVFQKHWQGRHRCIVTYRSSQQGEGVLKILAEPLFRHYDIATIQPDQAVRYLRNYRLFERRINEEENQPPVQLDVDAECTKLKEFLDRHVRRGESLISTPLIMHLVSLLDAGQIDQVETLAELYRKVTERLLEDQEERRTQDPELTRQVRASLVRVALAIQSLGAEATSLPAERFDALMHRPESGKRDRVMQWHPPEGSIWLEGVAGKLHPYYEEPLLRDEWRLREYGLFRGDRDHRDSASADAQALSYLHDSFLCFFEAVALRDYLGWGQPPDTEDLDPRWFSAVVVRIKTHPERWILTMEFLGGMLTAEEFEALMLELLLVHPVPSCWPDLIIRTARGATQGTVLARALDGLACHIGPLIRRVPIQIAEQTYALVYNSTLEPVCRFAARLRLRLTESGRSWLRLSLGNHALSQPVMTESNGEVYGLAILSDGRIASASLDRVVRVWDPSTGKIETIGFDRAVESLALLPDDRLACGLSDRTVRICDVTTGEMHVIVHHADGITALAATRDGRIASGLKDGTVTLCDPSTGDTRIIGRHGGPVNSLAALPDGCVASGSDDTTVRIWDPTGGESLVIAQHDSRVRTLAVLADGRIASGSWDHTVRLWDPASGESSVITHYDYSIEALAVLPDGRIVTGLSDNTVRLLNTNGGGDIVVAWHPDSLYALAALNDGRIVTASGGDGTLRVWNLSELSDTTDEHFARVNVLAILPDGRVVSGSDDHSVRLWDPEKGTSSIAFEHDGAVTALWITPDGRVASGSRDRTVRFWEPKSAQTPIITHPGFSIDCLTALPDGRVVAGSDRLVRLYDPSTGESSIIAQHHMWVKAVAALHGGQVVSGSGANIETLQGREDTLQLWSPTTRKTIKIVPYALDAINTLAVLSDGRLAIASGGAIHLWDPTTNKFATVIQLQQERGVMAIATLTDRWVAFGSSDGTVCLRDLAADQIQNQKSSAGFSMTDCVTCLAADMDRRNLVVGLEDGRVLIFAIESEPV